MKKLSLDQFKRLRSLPDYVPPWTEEEMQARIDDCIEKNRREEDDLEFTLRLMKMWHHAYSIGHRVTAASLLKEAEAWARVEWGNDTAIVVDHDVRFVSIESFDGRNAFISFRDLSNLNLKLEPRHLRILDEDGPETQKNAPPFEK